MVDKELTLDSIKDEVVFSSAELDFAPDALATDGEVLYSIGPDGFLTTWSLDTLRLLRTYKLSSEGLLSIVLDYDHLYLGSTYSVSALSVWRRNDLSPVISIKDEQGSILSLFDAGNEIVAARSSGTLDFFSKSDWMKVMSLDSQHAIATTTTMDDHFIYVGGIDDFVTVFNRSTYGHVTKLEGHYADIFSLYADTDYLYSGSGEVWWGGPGSPRPPSFESAIRIWDKGTWECIALLEGHTDNVNVITGDEHYIYSVSDDGSLRSYSKSDWSQTVLIASRRAVKTLLLYEDHLYISDADGKIMKIRKDHFS